MAISSSLATVSTATTSTSLVDYDAVVVPGGGLGADGRPHAFVRLRLDYAAEQYKGQTTKPKLIVLSGGSTHKPPPPNGKGFPITEAAASARYLLEQVSRHHILKWLMVTRNKSKGGENLRNATHILSLSLSLLQHSIPPNSILEEGFSLDTIGNAYWLRTVHTEFTGLRRSVKRRKT